MSRRAAALWIGRPVLLATALATTAAGIVLAAEPTPAPSGSAASNPNTAPVFADPVQMLNSFALLLGFALIVVLLVVVLVLLAQSRYFDAVERLAKRGMTSKPEQVSATGSTPAAEVDGVEGVADAQPTPTLTIAGPDVITVGTPGSYRAEASGGPSASNTVWTVVPSDRAKVEPATGASAKVTASSAGPFILNAKLNEMPASFAVSAELPKADSTVLPFIGGGWGSIIVSIVVAVFVAVLGVAKILDGQAIAALYGTLMGYVLSRKPSGGGTGGGGDTAPPSAPAAPPAA
jgi:hypothetical protein